MVMMLRSKSSLILSFSRILSLDIPVLSTTKRTSNKRPKRRLLRRRKKRLIRLRMVTLLMKKRKLRRLRKIPQRTINQCQIQKLRSASNSQEVVTCKFRKHPLATRTVTCRSLTPLTLERNFYLPQNK